MLARASRALLRSLGARKPVPQPEAPARPRLSAADLGPIGHTVYAVGDVHGCAAELRAAEARIMADARATRPAEGVPGPLIVMLGDYVDRGPASAQVLDHLLAPPPAGFRRVCLCGNHEEIMLRFLDRPLDNLDWLDLGGEQTLRSYGISFADLRRRVADEAELVEALKGAVPARHRTFLAALPVVLDLSPFVFVHAGIRPGVALSEQTQRDLVWVREPFISRGPELPGVTVVHGHTPSSLPSFGDGRIGIDTGAFATGRLTVLRIRDGEPVVL